jgi:hypothetical protein
MNPQTPPNSAPSPERPAGGVPERFRPVPGMEQAPMPEAAEVQPQVAADHDAPASQSPLVPPMPQVSGQPAGQPASLSPSGSATAPPTAADVDVIEPEWVEKAEQTVRAHYGDPYAEEEAVEDLQVDYLKKRYGYNVADPNGEQSKSEGK